MVKKSKKSNKSEVLPEDGQEPIPSEEIIEDAVEIVEEEAALVEDADDIAEESEDTPKIDADLEADVESFEDLAPAEDAVSAEASPAVAETRRGGFFPLLVGGLIAGGIGYGVSYLQWGSGSDVEGQLSSQAEQIAALQDQIENLPAPTDTAPLETQIGELSDGLQSIGSDVANLGEQFTNSVERIDALERRPNADGTLADTAMAAFEDDIQVLRDQLVEQQGELQAMASSAADQLEATREEAISIEANAVATARKATARTVLAQIQSSMDTGAPLGALLADLEGALQEPLPEALSSVADGAPTLASLQSSFPDLARDALSLARREGVSGEDGSGLTSFLRNQFDVRSTAPKDGDSADAVLSRAEASLKTGQLNDALAEVSGLPEVVRAALSDWISQAELRASALDAIAQLSDTLNIN